MKRKIIYIASMLALTILSVLLSVNVHAQESIEINKQEVSSWFANNWMWVTGGVVLLLILALAGRSSRKRRTTTVVKDTLGNVRSVTTTEVKE